MKQITNQKLEYIVKIMDLVGETESKKHGYYKVLKFADFKFSWDSWNNTYYLENASGHLEIEDYTDIIYKACLAKYNLPSTKDLQLSELKDLLDYLYIKDEKIKAFFDNKTK